MRYASTRNAWDDIKAFGDSIKNLTLRQWIILLIAGAVLWTVLNLGWQPWLALGRDVAGLLVDIPLIGWLTSIPLIGGIIAAITSDMSQLAGLSLWAGCQFVQIAPFLMVASGKYTMSTIPQKMWWLYAASYLAELSVTMLLYPIYGDGIGHFVSDIFTWNLDTYYVNKNYMIDFLATALSFELVVGTASYFFEVESK